MMARISRYWRPGSISEALELERRGAVVIGGGTEVVPSVGTEPVEVVDLQDLGLDGIERVGRDCLRIGAAASLQELADTSGVPEVVREAARRARPSILRSQATVGGCIMSAGPESELMAALLAHDAVVRAVAPEGVVELELSSLLHDRSCVKGTILTDVTIQTAGVCVAERTARTRADPAIVAAVCRRREDGTMRLALSGVSASPVAVAATSETLSEELSMLETPEDFRGSADYRRRIAAVLAKRVLEKVA